MSAALRQYLTSRFFAGVGSSAAGTVAALIAVLTFDATSEMIAVIVAMPLVIGMLVRILIAGAIDRAIDERRIMVVFGLVAAASAAIIPVLWLLNVLSFWVFIVFLAFESVCLAIVGTAGFRIINALSDPGSRTRAVGQLNGVHSVSAIVGQSVGGFLAGVLAPPLARFGDALFSGVGAVLVPRPPASGEAAGSADADELTPSTPLRVWRRVFAFVLRRPAFALAVGCGIAGSLIEPVVMLYLIHELELTAFEVGLALATGTGGGAIGGFALGGIISRLGLRGTLLGGAVLLAAGTASMVLLRGVLPGFWIAVLFEFLTAFGGVAAMAAAMGDLQEHTDRAVISRTMAGAASILELAAIAFIAVGAAIAAGGALALPFYLSLGVYAVIMLAIAIWFVVGRE